VINKQTGKTFKYLVPSDRLKKYTGGERVELRGRMGKTGPAPSPESTDDGDKLNKAQVTVKQKADKQECNGFEPAVRILRQRRRGNKIEYQVLFQAGGVWWCDRVSDVLLSHYRMTQAQKRARKRLRKG